VLGLRASRGRQRAKSNRSKCIYSASALHLRQHTHHRCGRHFTIACTQTGPSQAAKGSRKRKGSMGGVSSCDHENHRVAIPPLPPPLPFPPLTPTPVPPPPPSWPPVPGGRRRRGRPPPALPPHLRPNPRQAVASRRAPPPAPKSTRVSAGGLHVPLHRRTGGGGDGGGSGGSGRTHAQSRNPLRGCKQSVRGTQSGRHMH